jgi:hypothetical protein
MINRMRESLRIRQQNRLELPVGCFFCSAEQVVPFGLSLRRVPESTRIYGEYSTIICSSRLVATYDR